MHGLKAPTAELVLAVYRYYGSSGGRHAPQLCAWPPAEALLLCTATTTNHVASARPLLRL